MKRILAVALVCLLGATFLGLSACSCGGQPPTLEWQPLPIFRQHTTSPTQTYSVPMVPQYAPPSQPYGGPPAAPPCP